MRPPGNADLPPFRQYGRVMSFLLGDGTHLIGKVQRLHEIAKLKDALQPLNSVALYNDPIWHLLHVGDTLLLGHFRRANPTYFAFHFSQFFHQFPLSLLYTSL